MRTRVWWNRAHLDMFSWVLLTCSLESDFKERDMWGGLTFTVDIHVATTGAWAARYMMVRQCAKNIIFTLLERGTSQISTRSNGWSHWSHSHVQTVPSKSPSWWPKKVNIYSFEPCSAYCTFLGLAILRHLSARIAARESHIPTRESTRCVSGIWNCHIRWFYDVYEFSHSVYCGWVVSKAATYRDPKDTCRGSAKRCVIC